MALKNKVGKVICPLGVGEHLEYWGFKDSQFLEMDWGDSAQLDADFTAHAVPARHFSGRNIVNQNKTLWAAFVLEAANKRFYLGGDGGYDTHFAEIGAKFGEFDLAILENGQYNTTWKYVHLMPEETVQAALDLRAKALFPVHSSKFVISTHPWDEPLQEVSLIAEKRNLRLVTPKIGEEVDLNSREQVFVKWWEEVEQRRVLLKNKK